MSESTTTTATMSNDNKNSSINNLASDYDFGSVGMNDMMNCVRSHTALSRYNPSCLILSAVPGDHMLI